ncbi:MAG: helix-turn-helix transcriptional regulator, partial [Chloroflexi bacterium]|nr:helix-turn-helix transcriptional regulator [Chloroflexota bacterium]
RGAARRRLALALELAEAAGLWHFDLWDPATVRRVLDFALVHSIRPDYIRGFIERRQPAAARLNNAPAWASPSARAAGLSAREWEVLGLLATGASNRKIADQLCISAHTVNHHVHSILTKLGAGSRGVAVARALGIERRSTGR